MDERNFTIKNKAACYGIAAFAVLVMGAFMLAGSDVAFKMGVFIGVTCPLIAELLIVIPPKEGE